MTAAEIARQLGLRRTGREYTGACPSCGYKSGFAVTKRDGIPLLYCAANRCSQPELKAALRQLGLWGEESEYSPRQKSRASAKPVMETVERVAKERASTEQALAIWRRSRPIAGTVAERYLRNRGITIPLPPTLRLSNGRHPSTGNRYHPMLVASVLIGDDLAQVVAVHRTFLRSDGEGKAHLEPVKMTLGPIDSHAIPLAPAGPVLAVAEGLETALSFMQTTGIPTWAALSTGGIRGLILPEGVRDIVIAADADVPGIRAAQAAARRWLSEVRQVRIVRPPIGLDFNDLVRTA